jgi:nitrogen regulatory protein P-II 1
MKKIETIIRKSKFDELKSLLNGLNLHCFTYWDVIGVGEEKEELVYRASVIEMNAIERVMISIVVSDNMVEEVVNAVIKSSQTGNVGDGKIFISSIDEVVRIRDGKRGCNALGYNNE